MKGRECWRRTGPGREVRSEIRPGTGAVKRGGSMAAGARPGPVSPAATGTTRSRPHPRVTRTFRLARVRCQRSPEKFFFRVSLPGLTPAGRVVQVVQWELWGTFAVGSFSRAASSDPAAAAVGAPSGSARTAAGQRAQSAPSWRLCAWAAETASTGCAPAAGSRTTLPTSWARWRTCGRHSGDGSKRKTLRRRPIPAPPTPHVELRPRSLALPEARR